MGSIALGVVLESFALPFRQALDETANLGLKSVQFDAVGELSPQSLGQTARREVRTLLKSHGTTLAALNCPLRHGLETHHHQQQRLEHIGETMKLTYELDSRLIVLPFPAISQTVEEKLDDGPKPFLFFGKEPTRDEVLRQSLETLGQLGEKYGVTIAFECGLDDGVKLQSYFQQFQSPWLMFTFDPANFLTHNHDPVTTLMSLHDRIVHVHARDVRKSDVATGTREVPVGQGDIDWPGLLGTLGTSDFRGSVCIERTSGSNRMASIRDAIRELSKYVLI